MSENRKSQVTSIFSALCLITRVICFGLSIATVCESSELIKAGDLRDHSPSHILGEVFFNNDKSLLIHDWKANGFYSGKHYFITGTSMPYNNRLVFYIYPSYFLQLVFFHIFLKNIFNHIYIVNWVKKFAPAVFKLDSFHAKSEHSWKENIVLL